MMVAFFIILIFKFLQRVHFLISTPIAYIKNSQNFHAEFSDYKKVLELDRTAKVAIEAVQVICLRVIHRKIIIFL